MGEITAAWFGILAIVGLALTIFGAVRRQRWPVALGVGLLLSLAGAWVFGLAGAAIGLVMLAFLRRSAISTAKRDH